MTLLVPDDSENVDRLPTGQVNRENVPAQSAPEDEGQRGPSEQSATVSGDSSAEPEDDNETPQATPRSASDEGSGASNGSDAAPSAVAFASPRALAVLSAGGSHTCRLGSDGSAECWGLSRYDRTSPEPGSFAAIASGGAHSCGLRQNGVVDCWGWNDFGQAQDQPDRFVMISAGHRHTCGVKADETVVCWGSDEYGQTDEPEGAFISVAAGFRHSCAVRSNGAVECWGWNGNGQAEDQTGVFTSVTVGDHHSCGLQPSGEIVCWGGNDVGQLDRPLGHFLAISAGAQHTCGLQMNETVQCWGGNDYGQTDAPSGPFVAVTAGRSHTCALRSDQAHTCWGSNEYGQVSAQPTVPSATPTAEQRPADQSQAVSPAPETDTTDCLVVGLGLVEPLSADSIENATQFFGSWTEGDCPSAFNGLPYSDRYSFVLNAEGLVSIHVAGLSRDMDLTLSLFNAYGSHVLDGYVVSAISNRGKAIERIWLSPGEYLIEVSVAGQPELGDYRLSLWAERREQDDAMEDDGRLEE